MNELKKMQEDMEFIYKVVKKLTPIMNKMDFSVTGAGVCMILEEYAKANNANVVELAELVAEMVKQVNEDLGKY